MKALKYIRIALAAVMFFGIAALLLDGLAWTLGTTSWLSWMPKIQLLPAILALNVVIVVLILLVTALVGRLYCSVVCPLGILQDFFTWLNQLLFRRKFHYFPPLNELRYAVLAFFVALMVLGSFSIANGIAGMIDPYSMFARMTTGFFASGLPLIVAVVTLAVIFIVSFFWGRLWCNTICPMGALLSIISKHSLFGIRIDREKCVGCQKCEQRCKANCIDLYGKSVDTSRCVLCFNCLGHCKQGAIKLARKDCKDSKDLKGLKDPSRRKFLSIGAAVGAATVLHAQEEKVADGMAIAKGKTIVKRYLPLKPAGSISLRNFESRCTACQLCVSKCPNHLLRPTTSLDGFMQPSLTFDQGYCRPDCNICSQVCPTGAIQPVDKEEKTAISIGYPRVIIENCLGCGICIDKCPASGNPTGGALFMARGGYAAVADVTKCIGCGSCEFHCPATPKAILVEGRERHEVF